MRVLIVLLLMYSSFCVANEIGKPFVQVGHSNLINSIAISPDGEKLLSASSDFTLILWDIKSGQIIRKLRGHNKAVYSAAFSPSGSQIISGSKDESLILWDVYSGRIVKRMYQGTGLITSVVFSPDGRLIALGSFDGNIDLIDVASGKIIDSFNGNFRAVRSISFSPDGLQLVSGGDDASVRLWNIESGELITTFSGHGGAVNCVIFGHEGEEVVSASGDGTIRFWNIDDEENSKTLKQPRGVGRILITRDGLNMMSSGEKYVWVWNLDNSSVVKKVESESDIILDIAITPDDKQIIIANMQKELGLWDLTNGKKIRSFETLAESQMSAVFNPDGKSFFSGSGNEIKVWDIENGRLDRSNKGHIDDIDGVAFGKKGSDLITSGRDKYIKHWEVSGGDLIKVFEGDTKTYGNIAVSPDGSSFAAAGGWNKSLKLWDIKSGKIIKEFVGTSSNVNSVVFSPDGKKLVSSDLGNIKLWDIKTGRLIKEFRVGDWIICFAISPDGKTIVTDGSREGDAIKVWDLSSGRFIKGLNSAKFNIKSTGVVNDQDIRSVRFSQDGKYLVAGGVDNKVWLWDFESGEVVKSFNGHTGWVGDAVFSPDGKKILSSSWDRTVRLWDIKSGKELAQFVTFSDGEWVVITPNGYFDASKNGAKYLKVLTGASKTISAVDAFYEKFYRPDMVKLVIAGKKIDGIESLGNIKTPPEVEIINTAKISQKDSIEVTLKITDLGGGIGDIRLYRNETAIQLDGLRGLKRKADKKVIYKTYTIKLENGKNEIKAIAFDAKNWGRSEYAVHNVIAKIRSRKPALHAVVLGIENYRNKKLNLKYADDDAKLFANSLKKYSKDLFSKITVDLMVTKDNTTKDKIVAKLKNMQKLNPQDLFVFYVASHGTVDDGLYYLITSNVGSTSTRKLKKDAISQDTLKSLISNIPTSKKMIVLDTCNSQALGDSLQVAMLTRGMSESTAMKVLSRAVGSTILSASTSAQEALEGYKGHGLFTYVLAEGLKGKADSNKDGFVKTTELADYIEDEVPELAEKVFGREQFPSPARNGQAYPISKVQ